MLAKDEGHTLGQVGREQGVDVVIRRHIGYGQAVFWESPHRPEIREWGASVMFLRLGHAAGARQYNIIPIDTEIRHSL